MHASAEPRSGVPGTTGPDAELTTSPTDKLDELRSVIAGLGSVVLGLSGGVDSTLLAKVCHDELGAGALAIIARSPSLPERELAGARSLAEEIGVACREVATGEVDDPRYAANTGNRCYFCKHELFTHLQRIAAAEGFATIAYGENVDDDGDHRPGRVAATEQHVRAPLRQAGLSKDDVRSLARALGLPVADKPAFACLASRVPVGHEVTPAKLGEIERAETALWDLGFDQRLRVRHHGDLARIEVPTDVLGDVVEAADAIVEAVRAAGFTHVTLDLAGYRRGGGIATATRTLPVVSSA